MAFVKTKELAVGYRGRAVIRGIDFELERGRILTLLGQNGAGKSTILKTITRNLEPVGGGAYIGGQGLRAWKLRELARSMAVLLTERAAPELVTCEDVVAMGRYPYTNFMGRLTDADRLAARGALDCVGGLALAEQDFSTLSDGQRQRILLARAICQEPELLVLDEPTAYLDLVRKAELLDILREMARSRNTAMILSLHEIDLALKASDYILCIKDGAVAAFGTPEDILRTCPIESLYDTRGGSYDPLFGGVELSKTPGRPRVFVVAGGGCGVPVYRALQRRRVPFATGILFENDIDYHGARQLTEHVVGAEAFAEMTEAHFEAASSLMASCEAVIDAGTPVGKLNARNGGLLQLAREGAIPVYKHVQEWEEQNG